MKDIVWIIIILLIVGWLFGFLSFGAVLGNLVHILLIVAVILIVLKLLDKI
ncbi:MAG: lmo0937 family membrane protein [Saprospiraceae bacterium]|nr:lmo0937 family membrane protein [Saprospiraceae bacterium]